MMDVESVTTMPSVDELTRTVHIYGIGLPLAAELRGSLLNMAKTDPDEDIHLHFTSHGGDVYEAVAIVDLMTEARKFLKMGRFVGHINGMCASSALIIFESCDLRLMSEWSQIFVHGITDELHDNNFQKITASLESFRLILTNWSTFLAARTDWKYGDWFKVLSGQTQQYLGPLEAHTRGFIDEVTKVWQGPT